MRCLCFTLVTLIASSCASVASAVVIDNFTAAQFGLLANNGTPDVNGTAFAAPTSIIGLERDVRLLRTGSGPSSSSVNFFLGAVQLVPGGSSPVTVTFQWDGFADGTKNTIDIDGLPITNLTAGGGNAITTAVVGGAAPISATFTVWDAAGDSATNSLVIPASYSGELLFLFEDFTPTANLSQARALQLQVFLPTGVSLDINGIIQTENLFLAAPEPGMMTILAPLVLGMAWRRRRATKKLAA